MVCKACLTPAEMLLCCILVSLLLRGCMCRSLRLEDILGRL